MTSNNVLKSPYMVQERAPGSDLLAAHPTLTRENMCQIAHDLGTFFASLHSIQSTSAGYPVLSPSEGALMIRPFQDTDESAASRYDDGPPKQTTVEMVLSLLSHKKLEFEADGPDSAIEVDWCDFFSSIASEMNTLGVLREDHNCLCHQDLYPRNILVNPSSGQFKIITAVLDWDSAMFAPLFMSCKPPRWLWAWSGDEDDEDEQLPNDEPATPAMAEIKRVFEDAAGPIYHQFAYGTQYRLARRFIRHMLRGLTGDEDVRAAELLKDEWAQMKTELANGDMMEM